MSTKRKAESRSRTAHIMKSGDSMAHSERDSGFSDTSSEHMSSGNTTDPKELPRPAGQQGPQASGSGHQPSQLAVVGNSYSNMSPMIIMNNVLLKQPGENPALRPWGLSPTVEVVQPMVQQPQVVFVQPVVSRQASPATSEATHRHSRHKKYRPVLKSYPKIAPHPGDCSSGRGHSSSSSSTSSSFSSSKRGSSLTSKHREHIHKEKKPKTLGGAVSKCRLNFTSSSAPITMSPLLQSQLSSPTTETSISSSPAMERPSSAHTSLSFKQTTDSKNQTPSFSQKDTQAIISLEESDQRDHDPDTRRKRFCNTYNILSKSGLLDITLRTKELLRQNRHTQIDLDQLKEHTHLFLEALQSGDISICGKLQENLYKGDGDGETERERAAQASLKAD